ncbi:FliG C-terminal domain-containing protein [Octadecabacter sp. R77987]|uniref:FliG C-terminal domain-containing protein n=1 Tax=Octadecabacter sp. R77987 TaxID=3093874 RepID=UPI00366D0E5E
MTQIDETVSRSRKAAMVVQMLLAEGQRLSLSSLPEETQLRLTRELGAMRTIDRTTLLQVAAEFTRDLESVALTAPGGVEKALHALDGQISPATAARLREEASKSNGGDPWAQVIAMSPSDLRAIATGEALEVCAVLMSKLPVAKAAELMGLIPGERARRIAFAISRTSAITPDAVARIGAALANQYAGTQAPVFAQPPVQRVGAILNSVAAATRDSVLAGLVDEDAGFADDVRKAIFTFPDITTRLAAGDVPKVIRNVDNADLVTALAAATASGGQDAESADFVLANMSQRMADSLREEMGERGKVKKSDGESAMNAVVAAIREAVDAGEITLVSTEEEED